MALDVNGYNATFKSFVEFAQQSVNANDAKAVANAKIQRPLGGRKMIEADLYRPGNYSIVDGKQDILPPDGGFGFSFPGEERFITNGSEAGRANILKVGDKVEAMCGRVHAK